MAEIAVVDASPLILLERAESLALLRGLAREILVPRAVVSELRAKGNTDRTVVAVESAAWISIVDTGSTPRSIANWELGAGETAVLSYAARHTGVVAVLDDLAARRCAQTIGVDLLGTISVVLLAKRRGELAAARPTLERLVQSGMYISKALLVEVLARVDE